MTNGTRILQLGIIAVLTVLALSPPSDSTGNSAVRGETECAPLPDSPKVVAEEKFPDGLPATSPQGELRIDLVSDPGTFNPLLIPDSSSSALSTLLHGTLLEIEPLGGGRGIIQSGLAEAFRVSPDFREVTLYLRPRLCFSDGTPLTAEDVEFTLNQVVFNDEVPTNKELWKVGGQLPQVSAVDRRTVRITTQGVDPKLLGNLANLPVLPQHILADAENGCAMIGGLFWGPVTAEEQPECLVGTGPFRLKRYVPDQSVELERNPYYWKADPSGRPLPYLQNVTLAIQPRDDQRLTSFIREQTDIYKPRPAKLPLLYGELATQGLDPDRAISVSDQASTIGELIFAFNQDVADPDLRELFRDVRFRRAISYALNRDRIIATDWTWKRDATEQRLAEARCSPGMAESFWAGDQLSFGFIAREAAGAGVEVKLVPPTSPAAAAGLQEGDLILRANGQPIEDLSALSELLRDLMRNAPDQALRLAGEKGGRGGSGFQIAVTPWCDFSPDQAAELLQEMGKTAVEFNLLIAQGEGALFDEATILKESLKELGITVQAVSLPFPLLKEAVLGGWPPTPQYEAVRLSLGGGGDPTLLAEIYGSCGALHFFRYSDCIYAIAPGSDGVLQSEPAGDDELVEVTDEQGRVEQQVRPGPDGILQTERKGDDAAITVGPSPNREAWQVEVDDLFRQQAREANPDRRLELVHRLQALLAENVPVIWSAMPHQLCAYRYNRVKNFRCGNLSQDATIQNNELIYLEE